MALSHHRKKHKEHLNRFQESRKASNNKVSGNPKLIFTIIGAILLFLLFYLGGSENIYLLASATIVGGFVGRILGKKLE